MVKLLDYTQQQSELEASPSPFATGVMAHLKYYHLFEQVVEESIMSIEEAIIENLRVLPSEKQQEVLDFVEFLKAKSLPKVSRRRIKGLCADLGVRITEEDIAQARHEMWGNFPKENVL